MGKYFDVTAALGKYFEALPFLNFQKQMVSVSKLKCPSKVSWEVSFSLYYTVIYGNCLGNVVMGMEKCGKMWKNVEKCVKMWKNVLETRFYYATYIHIKQATIAEYLYLIATFRYIHEKAVQFENMRVNKYEIVFDR